MIESILIILACIFFIIVIGFMFLSERYVSKKNNQPTVRELNKYYKEIMQTDEANKENTQVYYINMRAIRVLASTIVSTISRITLSIFNNGTSPCTINKIDIKPKKMENLYIEKEEFRRFN